MGPLKGKLCVYAVYAVETPAQLGTHVTTGKGARSSLKAQRMLQAVRSVHLLPDLEKAWWLSPAALERLMRSQPPRSRATDVSLRPGAVTLRKGTKAAGGLHGELWAPAGA